mmetsp:Transcript_8/g.28  ORF Transcript_8/g.28 Transcript_8/m.28 type:complete len:436 (+) Transcript_8:97-1404(+)
MTSTTTANTSFAPKLQIQKIVSTSPTFATANPTPSLMTSRPIVTSKTRISSQATPPRNAASPRSVYRTVKTSRKAPSNAALVGPVSSVSAGPMSAASGSGTSAAILTFGDSLTHGWTVQGGPAKPYGVYLAQLLNMPAECVVSAGKAGQKASEMAPRLAAELARGCHFDGHSAELAKSVTEMLTRKFGEDKMRSNQANKKPYDIVIVFAGTNDVRVCTPGEAVLKDLSVLHQLVRGSGGICIAVTVPPCGNIGRTATASRQAVNEGLRIAARGNSQTMVLADFDAELARMPPSQRDALYTDHVHFNESGYRFLAAVVQKVLQPLLGTMGKPLQPSPSFLSVPRPLALPVASPETKRPRLAHDSSTSNISLEVLSAITSTAGRLGAAAISSVVSASSARQYSSKHILSKTISAFMPKQVLKTARAPVQMQKAILVA